MSAQLSLLPQDLTALRLVLNLISDPVLLLGEALEVLEANPAAQQWLGQAPGQEHAKGLHHMQTHHGGRLGDWLRLASRALQEGRSGPPAPSLKLAEGQRAALTLLALPPREADAARWLLHGRLEEKLRGKQITALTSTQPSALRSGTLTAEAGAKAKANANANANTNTNTNAVDLAQWLELSPLAMVLFDDTGAILQHNSAFAALFQPTPLRLNVASASTDAGAGAGVDTHANTNTQTDSALHTLLGWPLDGGPAGSTARLTQAHLTDLAGRTRWLQGRVAPLVSRVQGTARRFIAVLSDHSAEQERDLAHQQLDALMDTAGVGLATFQQDAGWLSPRAPRSPSAGSPRNSAAGLQGVGRDIVEAASLPEFARLQRALKKGDRIEVRYAVRHPELGRRWLLTRVEPGQLASGQRTTSVVTLDVTAQQQAENRSEQLLHELTTIMDGASLGLAYLRGERLLRCNHGFEHMLGLPKTPAIGTPVAQLFAALPDLEAKIQAALPQLQTLHTFEAEFLQVGSELLQPRWLSLSLRRVVDSDSSADPADDKPGEQAGDPEIIAVISDISRLKAQQAELEALVQDRELMFSLSDVGIAILLNGRIARANDALAVMTGYRIHELNGLPHQELFESQQDYEHDQAIVKLALATDGLWRGERRVRRRDGSVMWMQVSKRVMRPGAPDEGQIATYVNVDDRRTAQQSLMLQTERERAVLDSVLVGIVTVGRGGIEWMNRSARRMFGGDLSEFVGRPMSIAATPASDHPFRQTQYLDELSEGQTETFECRLIARDGREFWVVGNAVVTGARATGRLLTYALLDIERRRQAEAQTAQAQASLARIIEAAPLAISLHDATTLCVEQINQAAAALAGRSEASLMGASPEDLFGAEQGEMIRRDMQAALRDGASNVLQREYRLGSNEQLRVWDARFLRLAGTDDGSGSESSGAPEQLLMVASDVTEHRVAEEARFQDAIAQRELLVREVHHRIKNNLQGVAGLLQQIATRRPEVAGVINEAVGQVHAIAQVYGLQVGSSGPLRIHRVMEAIIGSVQRMSGRSINSRVEGPTEAQAQQWSLPEAESIPIALTLNELLTNAIKHSRDSEVTCTLICGTDGVAVEIVNPGHLPPDFNLNQVPGGVSGLALVRALLPRRTASLTLTQRGDCVVCRVELQPPSVSLLASG